MLINDVSRKYNISVRTLRYYEELDLLNSDRNASNIRIYSNEQLHKLELILFFKYFNFKLKYIKEMVEFLDPYMIKSLFLQKQIDLNNQIYQLQNEQQIISSVLKTFGSADLSKHNIEEFIREQIYFQNNNERLIEMQKNTSDILIEISTELIPCATSEEEKALLPSIKALRKELQEIFDIDLELIRVKDNIELKNGEYQICQNGAVMVKHKLETENIIVQSQYIITQLKTYLINR